MNSSRRPLWQPAMPFLLLVAAATAQAGDRRGERQPLWNDPVPVPAAPVQTPQQALQGFVLTDGFRIELVAAEPLVADPVAACFDARGQLWVVEMRGFMSDLDGANELAPNGRIVVLRDEDGDGSMDSATVFLDGLVLPRAVLPVHGGALVIEPPHLLFCPDRDGDGKADEKLVLAAGFESGLDNPEHAGNGLLWGLDHRIHLAHDKRMWRWSPGGFRLEQGAGGGQWGIAMDDRGRMYFNYNEDWLRCDLIPGATAQRFGAAEALPLTNHQLVADRSIHPIRVTPGVNRGYQPGRLVDYRLAIHTAVCGPHIYRGELLPGCDGHAFVCEPAAHAVRRIALAEPDGRMHGSNFHAAEAREFLAATDERFRPVQAFGGPDGALYLVDMYRGLIQHRVFLTTYLRRQAETRGLAQPTGLGRIWRIVPATAAPGQLAPPPPLHDAPAAALVAAMAAASGVRRDLALRELVQRGEVGAAAALRAQLATHPRPGCRIGLLSALSGLGVLVQADLRRALRDEDAGVVAFALQLAAPFLADGDLMTWQLLAQRALAPGTAPTIAWHAAVAGGEVLRLDPRPRWQQRAQQLLLDLLRAHPADRELAVLVAHAAGDQLLALLQSAAAGEDAPAAPLEALARVLVRRREAASLLAFFTWAATAEAATVAAALRGAVAALPKGAARRGYLQLPATPAALSQLAAQPATAALAAELLAAIELLAAGPAAQEVVLSPDEQQSFRLGERLYRRHCAACHQLDGSGMAGLAPPLRDSEWVRGEPELLLRVLLHGLRGRIEVAGGEWELEMPGQGHLSDADLAATATYVRVAFTGAAAIDQGLPATVRQQHRERREPWTAAELQPLLVR